MTGPVQRAIRASVSEGQILHTPARRAPFIVERIDTDGIVLLLGVKRAWTPIPWDALEGVPAFLSGKDWVRITGTGFSPDIDPATFDGYMKGHVNRATAGWVAAVLATAGVVDIRQDRPASVRLKAGFA